MGGPGTVGPPPADVARRVARLGARSARWADAGGSPWYADYDGPAPLDCDAEEMEPLVEALRVGLAAAGVRLVAVRSRAIFEEEFNELVERHGSKGAALSHQTLALAARMIDPLPPGAISVICDKHGGRNRYGPLLAAHFPEWLIENSRRRTRSGACIASGRPERRVEVLLPHAGRIVPAGRAGLDGVEIPPRAGHAGVERLLARPRAGAASHGRIPARRQAVPRRHRRDASEAAHRRSSSLEDEIMDLYIVRHAWAADRDDPRWPEDDLRPLTEEGQERFAQMAAKLVGRGMRPEVVATSPLVRCVETARDLGRRRGQGRSGGTRRVAAGQRRGRPAALDRAAGPQASADRLGGPCARRGPAGRRDDRRRGGLDSFCEGERRRHPFRRSAGPRRRRAAAGW